MLIVFVVIFIGLRIIDSHQQAVCRTNQADIETVMALHNGMDESWDSFAKPEMLCMICFVDGYCLSEVDMFMHVRIIILFPFFQAFLEFGDESAAVNMVSYYATNPAQVRLKPCYVQFSNHKELKTDASHSFQVNLVVTFNWLRVYVLKHYFGCIIFSFQCSLLCKQQEQNLIASLLPCGFFFGGVGVGGNTLLIMGCDELCQPESMNYWQGTNRVKIFISFWQIHLSHKYYCM